MKIVGVVNNYNDALDLEEIVKVFTIEKRIFNLLSYERKKKVNNVNSNFIMLSKNDVEYNKHSEKKALNSKNENDFINIFNVRGLF